MVVFNSYVNVYQRINMLDSAKKMGLNLNLITFSWGDGICVGHLQGLGPFRGLAEPLLDTLPSFKLMKDLNKN